MRKLPIAMLLLALACSVGLNVKFYREFTAMPTTILFSDANSRDTYFSVHKVRGAHEFSRGAGVKVGILDSHFGSGSADDMYASAVDFLGDPASLAEAHHGYFMACALREIAPDCEIYALNVMHRDEGRKVSAIIEAIDWAIASGISVLSYSGAAFPAAARSELDAAISRAAEHGIVTCFINYDAEANLLPYGLYPYAGELAREPDVNILHYDYNALFLRQYRDFVAAGRVANGGNDIPYFSVSSTAPVLAGFVAILRGIDPDLSPGACRAALVDTSYTLDHHGKQAFEHGHCPRVADVAAAAQLVAAGR